MSAFLNILKSSPNGLIFLFVVLVVIVISSYPSAAGQHCGAENDWRSQLVPDYWPPKPVNYIKSMDRRLLKPVRFYKACKRHDDCYDTYGGSRSKCDQNFYRDMKAECGKVYGSIWELPQKKACEGAAYGYYRAVRENGEPAYLSAQKEAAPRKKAAEQLQAVKK